MEIKLTPDATFTLQINGKTETGFKVESSWECFTKYSNGKGWIICFSDEARELLSLLGMDSNDVQVVAFSPSLKNHFSQPDAAK